MFSQRLSTGYRPILYPVPEGTVGYAAVVTAVHDPVAATPAVMQT